jgi:hypothetical protein
MNRMLPRGSGKNMEINNQNLYMLNIFFAENYATDYGRFVQNKQKQCVARKKHFVPLRLTCEPQSFCKVLIVSGEMFTSIQLKG